MADERTQGRHFTRRRRRWWQVAITTVGVLLTVMCLSVSALVFTFYKKTGAIPHFSHDEAPVTPAAPGEPQNFLIVGSDSRDDVAVDDPDFGAVQPNADVGGKRSDTILLARIDPGSTQIQMVSFPRDLFVPISGHDGRNRINTAWGEGRDVLINTIREDFDIEINHYIEVDFTGFQGLVSAVGGIPIYLDTAYKDPHSGLEEIGPGCVTLDGPTALAFARSRYLQHRQENGRWSAPDPTADLGRITRQQLFIRKALERVLALNPFASLGTLSDLLNVAKDSVTLDDQLSIDDLRDLAEQFRSFNPETIQNYSLPVTPFTTNAGAEVLDIDMGAAQRIFNVFRGVDPNTLYPDDYSVQVSNGTGVDHQATDVATALTAIGFDSAPIGDADEPVATTTIAYAPGSEAVARFVARYLTSRADMVVDDSLDPGTVRLTTGADFTTVVRQPWPEEAVPLPTTTVVTTPASGDASSSTTASTAAPPPTAPTTVVGVIPEAPPPGVTC